MKKQILLYAASGVIIAILMIGILENYGYITPTGFQTNTQTGIAQSYNLAIALTDPPISVVDISAVYLGYENIEIHSVNNDSWISLNESGFIELSSLTNLAQIIHVTTIPAGKYNLIRFLNASAIVTYQGENYTAKLPSNQFLVNISPPVEINDQDTSVILIDIVPKIIMSWDENGPKFFLVPFAKAFTGNLKDVFPNIAKERLRELARERVRIDLRNSKIAGSLISIERYSKIKIVNATISSNGLELTVINLGDSNVSLKLVAVYAFMETVFEKVMQKSMGMMLFLITPEGSLVPIERPNRLVDIYLGSKGYVLEPGKSVTLKYEGPLSMMNFSKGMHGGWMKKGSEEIRFGSVYIITVIGDPLAFARTIVSAK